MCALALYRLFALPAALVEIFTLFFCVCEIFQQSAIIGKRSQRKLLIHFVQLFCCCCSSTFTFQFLFFDCLLFYLFFAHTLFLFRGFFYSMLVLLLLLSRWWWLFQCACSLLLHIESYELRTTHQLRYTTFKYTLILSSVVNRQQFFNNILFRVPFVEKFVVAVFCFGSRKNDTFEM